ncbi:hypothetical protein [Streptomyces prunicolor]
MDTSAEDPVDLTMTAEVYGVLREHAWIGQVGADHDLDADLFGLAVKRAAAYGWSSTRFSAGAELGGQRWGHADAGGDWSQDGRVRQLAWLTVYPAIDLREQYLPVLPLTRVMVDSLYRVGELDFAGLTVRVPVRLAPDTRFDLVGTPTGSPWPHRTRGRRRPSPSWAGSTPWRRSGCANWSYSAAMDSSARNT